LVPPPCEGSIIYALGRIGLIIPVYGGVGWVIRRARANVREGGGDNKNIGRGVLG
jgi:hypothetical protein